MPPDTDMLTGLSAAELEALADGVLVPARQARLDELLSTKQERALALEELRELDHLLTLADQLTILKTRARYTLSGRGDQACVDMRIRLL